MGIMNRRNAMLGWAVWTTSKRLAAHKAKRAVPSPAPSKKRRAVKAFAASAAVAAAAVAVKSRLRGSTEPPSESWPAETAEP